MYIGRGFRRFCSATSGQRVSCSGIHRSLHWTVACSLQWTMACSRPNCRCRRIVNFVPLAPRDVVKVEGFPFICIIVSKSSRKLTMPLRVMKDICICCSSGWTRSGSGSDRSGRDGHSSGRGGRNGNNSGNNDSSSGSSPGVLLSRGHVNGGGSGDDPTAKLLTYIYNGIWGNPITCRCAVILRP
jgi:hypothetical protein